MKVERNAVMARQVATTVKHKMADTNEKAIQAKTDFESVHHLKSVTSQKIWEEQKALCTTIQETKERQLQMVCRAREQKESTARKRDKIGIDSGRKPLLRKLTPPEIEKRDAKEHAARKKKGTEYTIPKKSETDMSRRVEEVTAANPELDPREITDMVMAQLNGEGKSEEEIMKQVETRAQVDEHTTQGPLEGGGDTRVILSGRDRRQIIGSPRSVSSGHSSCSSGRGTGRGRGRGRGGGRGAGRGTLAYHGRNHMGSPRGRNSNGGREGKWRRKGKRRR